MQLEDKIGIIIIQICMALGVAIKVESNDKASFPSIRETKAHFNNQRYPLRNKQNIKQKSRQKS